LKPEPPQFQQFSHAAINLNPYQGLKPRKTPESIGLGTNAAINLNPYQGLKRDRAWFGGSD